MRTLKITNTSLTLQEVTVKWKESTNESKRWRWQAIRLCLIEPRSAKNLGADLDKTADRVRHVLSNYNRFGPASIDDKKQGGDRWVNKVDRDKEKKYFESINEKAKKGEYVTIDSIESGYK